MAVGITRVDTVVDVSDSDWWVVGPNLPEPASTVSLCSADVNDTHFALFR